MTDWKTFKRKGTIEVRPCNMGDIITYRSIMKMDDEAYFKKVPIDEDMWRCILGGGVLVRFPESPYNIYFVNPVDFKKNYEEYSPKSEHSQQ